jgi:pimeloyl-ACP methyl ester carboxylesterase
MFGAVLPLLADAGFHVVAMDTPGFGLSDRPAEPVDIAGYAAAVPAVLDAMGWDRAHIVGHHTGASIACAFGALAPERINKIVLNGVALLSDEERAYFATFRFEPLAINASGAHLQAAWDQRLRASPGWSDLQAMHRHVVEMLANPDNYHWGFVAAFAHDLKTDLQAILSPTLILTNSGDDLFEASKRAHAVRPDFAFAALDGGTHDIVDEQPRAWTRNVIGWLG